MAVIGAAGEHIDLDIDGLAGLDVGELGFFVVGDDIGSRRRHDRHQLGAGLTYWPTRSVRLPTVPSTGAVIVA